VLANGRRLAVRAGGAVADLTIAELIAAHARDYCHRSADYSFGRARDVNLLLVVYVRPVTVQCIHMSGAGRWDQSDIAIHASPFWCWCSCRMNAGGDSIVLWEEYALESGWGVYLQRYSSSGQAQGSEFHVSAHNGIGNKTPRLAIDRDGSFVVSWFDPGSGFFAQRHSAAGQALGDPFMVAAAGRRFALAISRHGHRRRLRLHLGQ
jgi:hypothetical protein